jgi:hypothetical protein
MTNKRQEELRELNRKLEALLKKGLKLSKGEKIEA